MDAYDELLERLKDIAIIGQIGGLVSWDQEVLMPPRPQHYAPSGWLWPPRQLLGPYLVFQVDSPDFHG